MDPEKAPTIYSNNVQLRVSPWDFKFTFGEVIEVTEDSFEIKDKVVVYMSPQHAKAFADVMVKNLAQYEKNVGKIPNVLAKENPEDESAESV